MANDDLYNQIKKDVDKANRRLASIEKYTGQPYSWAGRQLYDILSVKKLNAWSDRNRIKIDKSMSTDDLYRVKSAVDRFLNSKTSSVAKIKKRAKGIKESFQSGISVTEEQAEHIYQAFEDDLIKWAVRYIDASELWALIQEGKETKMSEERFTKEFLKKAEKTVGTIDADFRDNISQLYANEVIE